MADQPQLHEHTPLLADPESTVDPPPPQAPWNWRRTLALAVFYALIAVFIFYSLSYFIADELVRYPPALATTISPYPTKFSIKWEHAVTLSPVRNYVTYMDDRDTGTKQPISTLSVIRRGGWFISGKSFWLQLQEKQNALPLSPEHLDPDKPAVYQVGDVRTGFSWWQVFFSDVPSALYITFHHDDATVDPLLRCEYRIDFYKLARRCPGEKSFQPVAHIYDGLWNLEEIYMYRPENRSDVFARVSTPRGFWLRSWDIEVQETRVPFPRVVAAIHLAHRDIWEAYLEQKRNEKEHEGDGGN